jgi:hypothetical protein
MYRLRRIGHRHDSSELAADRMALQGASLDIELDVG